MQWPGSICLRGNAPFASAELAAYLSRCAGCRAGQQGYPITLEATGGEGEGFHIAVTPEGTRIQSPCLRGVAYGVYAFLEWQFQCRFFAEDCEVIPCRKDAALIPGALSSSPDFAYRELYWRGAMDGRFALKCRLNSACAQITPHMGGKTMFYNYSHTFETLVPAHRWFDSHPEYFSLVNGVRLREHSQLCLTNQDVLRLCIEGVRAWINENPECHIFSVAQNDWYGACECDACRAANQREGSPAGTMIAFVNAIADAIAIESPQVMLHTFAYLYTRKAPLTVRPRGNVIVRLCSIECCFSHPIGKCDYAIANIDVEQGTAHHFAPCTHGFAEDLLAWSQCCDQLYIWDYTTNFSNYVQPFPNRQVLQPNLRLFQQCGVRGVFEQGNYAPGKASAFAPLKIYLLGKLLWHVEADVETLTTEFMAAYYGAPSARAMLECLRLLEEAAMRHHMGIFDGAEVAYLDEGVLTRADILLARALALAEEAVYRERLRRERLSVTYALLVRMPLDAPLRSERIDAFEMDAKELGITELFERRELQASFACMRRSRYAAEREGVPYQMYRL